jgi:hypothetical protein
METGGSPTRPALLSGKGHQAFCAEQEALSVRLSTSAWWHRPAYIIPATEDGAGSRVSMVLLNEQTVRIHAGLAPEIWDRCDVTS